MTSTDQPSVESQLPLEGPARLLAILAAAVFTIELSVMATFALLPPIPRWLEVFLDASLLVVFLFPVLYLYVFRPFRRLVARRLLAEQELAAANKLLQQDIAERKRIEEALRKSESRFREMLEEAPIGMAVTALDGGFMQVNQAFCDIVGYSKQELERMGYVDITFPEDVEENVACVQRLLDKGLRSCQMETRYLHQNGRLIWVKISCSVQLNADREPMYFIIQIEDITEYKTADERATLLTNVFEHSIEPILITDAHNRILEINPSFTQLTGYVLHDVLGKDPKMLAAHTAEQNREFYREMWEALQADGYWHGEIWDQKKDGSTFPRWLTITAVHDEKNRIINYIGSYTDISQLRR